jgi:secreted PhoX family phosphatase
LRAKTNQELERAGFDGNGRFSRIGQALGDIVKVLEKNGIQQADVFNADLFSAASGRRTFGIETINRDDAFSPTAIENSMLVIQWHTLDHGALEVIAYLS